jgi:hypothetical protein
MKQRIILLLVLVSILAMFIPLAPVDTVEAQNERCYIVSFTQVGKGDTWKKIAKHWFMDVDTLKAMNQDVKFVRGAWLKVLVYIGCPRPAPITQ